MRKLTSWIFALMSIEWIVENRGLMGLVVCVGDLWLMVVCRFSLTEMVGLLGNNGVCEDEDW